MALQIRRGTDAQRQGITPKAGEPIFTTDTKKLYVGDGSTAGGIVVDTTGNQITDIIEDITPQLGGPLDLNNQNIVGTGNIAISGQISANAIDLKGSLFADDSTLLVDGINGRIVGPVFANVTGDVTGNVTGNLQGNVEGGSIKASNGAVVLDAGNGTTTPAEFTGNATGNHGGTFSGSILADGTLSGDLIGSVFGDDSTPIIDGLRNKVMAATYKADATFEKEDGTRAKLEINSKQLPNLNGTYGNIDFVGVDTGGNSRRGSRFFGSGQGFFFMSDNTGAGVLDSHPENRTISISDSGIAYGLYAATAKLDIRGDAIITGGLTADVTGSLYSDSSTLLIDGTTGKIMVAAVDLVGQVGNTPGTPGAVDSWLEVKVNGLTKYIALYD